MFRHYRLIKRVGIEIFHTYRSYGILIFISYSSNQLRVVFPKWYRKLRTILSIHHPFRAYLLGIRREVLVALCEICRGIGSYWEKS